MRALMTVLVVLGIYPDIGFLNEIEKRIDSIYPEKIEWIRGDELILAVKESAENLSISIEKPKKDIFISLIEGSVKFLLKKQNNWKNYC